MLFFGLLLALPIARQLVGAQALAVFDSFFRAGSLVFGGGHVVLPLLQAEVVAPGWVTGEQFVAGYGAAQAVPGPLFTFAAYLGAVMGPRPNGVAVTTMTIIHNTVAAWLNWSSCRYWYSKKPIPPPPTSPRTVDMRTLWSHQ